MIKKIVVIVAVLGIGMHAMLQEASAQTSRLYFAGYLGLTTSGDQEFTESSIPRSGDIETKNANSFAGALGVRLSRQFRIEGEISYSAADMDRMDINNVGSFEMAGELTTWTALINAYYDFDVDWDLQPFIGAGLGISWHEGDINDLSGLALDNKYSSIPHLHTKSPSFPSRSPSQTS